MTEILSLHTFGHRSGFLKNDSERFFQPVFGLRFHHSLKTYVWQISPLTYELLGLRVHLASNPLSVGRHYSSHKGYQGRPEAPLPVSAVG